ncbi:MAG: type 4b pilus Flp secretin RcpA [Nevskia sp.]
MKVFMKIFRGARIVVGVSAALLAGAGFTVSAQGPAPETIHIEPGTHKLLRSPAAVGRVAIGDSKIADVNVINGRELLVVGIKSGVTSLLVWPRAVSKRSNGVPKEYRVSVGPPPSADPELSRLDIQPGGVIDGTAPSLLAHRRATLTAGPSEKGPGGDRSGVFGETQVTSQVRIVEVNRRSLQQYGINLFKIGSNSFGGLGNPGTVSSVPLSGVNSLAGAFGSATGFLPIGDAFNIVFGNNGYTGLLSVLERKGLARVLAEPSLTALSGQTASFLAGGEFPYPVPQTSGGAGTGTITVQFREFGVRLNLTPTVLANNRIAIKVAPEVSDLDFTNGLSISGTTVPGLIIRRTDTTVELGDGETFVISGLVSSNLTNNVDKVPWLGDIPVLGAFFRNTRIDRTEKELIMVVTPHLVRPIARGTALPPLPGESTDRYRPNFAETMFLETGDFGQGSESGYSK